MKSRDYSGKQELSLFCQDWCCFQCDSLERTYRHPRKVYYKASEGGYGEYLYNHCSVVKNDGFINSRMYSRAMNDKTYVAEVETSGNALGFFYAGRKFSKERIDAGLDVLCKDAGIPKELDLSLTEGSYNLKTDDTELIDIISLAHQSGRNYVLEATLPAESNKETATVLADVMNEYAISPLHENKENFWGDIVYKNKEGRYVFYSPENQASEFVFVE